MALQIHDRHDCLEAIPGEHDQLLRRHFSGQPISRDESQSLKRFLNDLRDRRYWLACDCCDDAGVPPLLSIRRTAKTVTLVRHGEVTHLEACPFYRDAPAIDDQEGAQLAEKPTSPLLPAQGPFLVLESPSPGVPGDKPTERNGPQKSKDPRHSQLAVILMTLLEDAGLNEIGPEEVITPRNDGARARDARSEYRKLDLALDRPVAPGIALRDVTCTHLSRVPRFLASFRKRCEPLFPKDIRPQGLTVFPINDWESHDNKTTLILYRGTEELTCEVHGTIRRYGRSNTPGPLWFIGQVGRESSTGLYEILHGYLHPQFSKTILMPVDSDLERRVANSLMGLISYWSWKRELSAILKKPLFDEVVAGGSWFRPDYSLILPNGRRLIVEVMGTDDPEYLERKKELKQTLGGQSDVGGVFSWGEHTEPREIGRALTAAAMKTASLPSLGNGSDRAEPVTARST